MTHKVADNFFNDIDFVSIVDTVKGIMTSDGSMSILLDFERVLDDLDIYAFKNWELGELVQGPDTGRYTVKCTFMWPYRLMPDPRAIKRLLAVKARVKVAKSSLKVPVTVKSYDDLVPGTNYPKWDKRKVWFVQIELPLHLLDSIKEGSIDLADQNIDLEDLDKAYEEDLQKEGVDDTQAEAEQEIDQALPGGL
jgi:hypothetical protein